MANAARCVGAFTKWKVVALAGALVAAGIFVHFSWADGLGYALCEFFMGDTIYSPGYTERAYIGIKVGCTAEEVQVRLGKPLGVTRSGECDYYGYSSWGKTEVGGNGPACNYTVRALVISNDVVIGKWHEYYWD